ncbi:phage/plasmid primase, P4 family [Paenibacillus chartarius]|uniref:Phage/plasmid primase, P4 family n=1 Tax=Paenibacillus chartarius TaxID=747481 RepID=A0ABV6DIG0_9BACL
MKTKLSVVDYVWDNCVVNVVAEDINYAKAKDALLQKVVENASNEEFVGNLVTDLVKLREDGKEILDQIILRLEEEGRLGLLSNSLVASYLREKEFFSLLPAGFAILGKFDYASYFSNPECRELAMIKSVRWRNRGLSISEKGKLSLWHNTFARYVLMRMTLVQHENGQLFVYSKNGIFFEINDLVLKTVCRNILHEAEPDIWCRSMETEYIEALKREIPIVESMNPEKGVVNLTNGMLDLYKMALVQHSPEFLSTVQVPFAYDPDAECPTFISFLEEVFEGDKERIMLIQEILGYLFLPDIKIQKAFFFVGLGSNGKSILAEVIRNLVGPENVSNISLSAMSGRFGMQDLPGKLVCMSAENEFSKKFNTEKFKMLTSGDSVYVEPKYHAGYNTVLSAKVVILLNRLMETEDLSYGFFRRLQIIPFNKTFKELKAGQTPEEGVSYADKNLIGKLLNEMPGILRFAMEGLTRLINNQFNLTESKVCEQALQDYKAKQNPVVEYFNSRIEEKVILIDPSATTRRSNFKKDFDEWARDNDYNELATMSTKVFLELLDKVLRDKGVSFRVKKLHGDMVVDGLQLCGYFY